MGVDWCLGVRKRSSDEFNHAAGLDYFEACECVIKDGSLSRGREGGLLSFLGYAEPAVESCV